MNYYSFNSNQIIILYILLIILLFIIKVFNISEYLTLGLILIILYINGYISFIDKENDEIYNYIININPEIKDSLKDKNLLLLIYKIRILNLPNKELKTLIEYLDDFLVLFKTIDNNRFNDNNLITKDIELNIHQQQLLLNNIREQMNKINKYVDTFIHIIPYHIKYLDEYYNFCISLKTYLSNNYYYLLNKYNINIVESDYNLLDKSNKYDYIR
jgi:hypothetical protein